MFSSLSFPNPLPPVTLVDGSRVSFHGVGTVKLFPFLTIDNVLYIPRSPFNLLSISRLTRSHGIYHLHPSTHVGAVMESPSLLHAQLSHPSLAKLKQLVPTLSKLSRLVCELCQLGKNSRTSFPRSVTRSVTRGFIPFCHGSL